MTPHSFPFDLRPQRAYALPVMAAIRYLFHRHHLSERMLGLISEYGGGTR